MIGFFISTHPDTPPRRGTAEIISLNSVKGIGNQLINTFYPLLEGVQG